MGAYQIQTLYRWGVRVGVAKVYIVILFYHSSLRDKFQLHSTIVWPNTALRGYSNKRRLGFTRIMITSVTVYMIHAYIVHIRKSYTTVAVSCFIQ